ncbi:intermembrane lipid transfer protein Vps13D-like [Leptidea sinapis]|uniref:intermembrane lipid transfer protein Vps13D-like n=1 Tax=Leptidea sinapis TaxID=189913 RepID=UPI0021C31A04|nr:intermembrane lipid transfer protein Vps13D-like [Leptidea sinapis]
MIREGLSAMNPAASAASWWRAHHATPAATSNAQNGIKSDEKEPLFQFTYEKRPFGLNCDHKVRVKCQSVEVVWCAAAARWAARWGGAAGAGDAGRAMAHVRDHTRATLRTHYERLLHENRLPNERRSWQVELDISAPQILFVEDLCERDAAVVLVDFGRLRLHNANLSDDDPRTAPLDDDEERFMTPCSTPPGSLLSPASPPDPPHTPPRPLDAARLHTSLYDRYKIELSELQILVGRVRDNWKYAHTKATSALHLLDRFTISLQAERRVLQTHDPQYPSAALCGSLPALVAHLSEHKLSALRRVLAAYTAHNAASASPPTAQTRSAEDEEEQVQDEDSVATENEQSEYSVHNNATLLLLQFAIDQLSLEVQSRGRSIAEVQVCGVRAAVSTRPADTSLSLSVHSLLLVDALQTYGPDFELLVASHKHVGMDTASGSIRGSEPTSPVSPTSPASPEPRAAPTPLALHHALYNLRYSTEPEPRPLSPSPSWATGVQSSMTSNNLTAGFNWGTRGTANVWSDGWGSEGPAWAAPGLVDSEALIAVDLCIVKGEADSEDLRIANILFNNLDVIANQETIVELIGFVQRVTGGGTGGGAGSGAGRSAPQENQPTSSSADDIIMSGASRTELTFDFHRLGVLLVRAGVRDGELVAHKIATATVCDARIQATAHGSLVEVSGSLGGVQVVSLSEEAGLHSRVLSAGRPPAPLAAHSQPTDEKALYFTISRDVLPADEDAGEAGAEVTGTGRVSVSVSVRVASVWYTHSGTLLRELQSCLTEFKRYLANLARSIRDAAHDMALGLVHPRADSLYSNPKVSLSMEGVSPRRRTTSLAYSLDEPDRDQRIVLSVSVELESPVVVLPRAARSPQVFVAHLGRMSLTNTPGAPNDTRYTVRVRDISLVSLEVSEELLRQGRASSTNMQQLYETSRGKPVLHDTALHLAITLADGDVKCSVEGAVVGGLHVTASRAQYQQLLDTLRWITDARAAEQHAPDTRLQHERNSTLSEPAVPTLRLDPAVRAAVLAAPLAPPPAPAGHHTPYIVAFELADFTVELLADLGEGERSLVALTFREFHLRHEHLHPYETALQVSLFSITMEDLSKEPDSRHRLLMVSHTAPGPPKAVFVSKSCPDFTRQPDVYSPIPDVPAPTRVPSLPALNVPNTRERVRERQESRCGPTPPCSPVLSAEAEFGPPGDCGEDNLVWVSVITRLPQHPHEKSNQVAKETKVEFNSLKLVLSIDSWVAVLDFFGVVGDESESEEKTEATHERENKTQNSGDTNTKDKDVTDSAEGADGAGGGEVSSLSVVVRSLSVVVVGTRGEVCRARVARAAVRARRGPAGRHVRAALGALALTDLAPRAPLWRDRLRTTTTNALTLHYHRLREEGASKTWSSPDDSWVCVRAADTEPFSFGARRGRAGGARGAGPGGDVTAPLHRLVLRVEGWSPLDPVCVDRVGVFFRHVTHDVRSL